MIYEEFFNAINNILSVSEEVDRQATIRGENYNIFNIMQITTNEVLLHSSIIKDLLDPNGLHGLGIKPLKIFLELLNLHFNDDDLFNAEVVKEYHISNITEDYSHGGNIDILMKINDYYLCIENKIYAGDQPKQLLRYKNFIKRHKHTLIYLTLDGHEASPDSACGLQSDRDYRCMSYGVEIYKWLYDILILSIDRPLVRETIQQYKRVIQQLTNQNMTNGDNQSLFIKMDKYPSVVREIVNCQWSYRLHLVETYILKPLKEHFENQGFMWYEDDSFRDQSKETGFAIYLPEWEKKICIEFEKYNFVSGYFGVWDPKSRGSEESPLLGDNKTSAWPYGWEYLKYRNWDVNIVEDIISGQVCQYIIDIFENIYRKIKDNIEKYPMN